MIKFENLTNSSNPNGDYSFKTKSSVIQSKSMGKLYCPYEGVVISTYNPKCSGYLLIQHLINNDVYYSEFCGIPKVFISKNDMVRKGQPIGFFLNDTDTVHYTLFSLNHNELDPRPFFKGFTLKDTKSKNTTSNNLTLNKVTPNYSRYTQQETNPKKKKSSYNNDDTKYEREKNVTPANNNLFLSLALSPFDFISKQTKKIAKNAGKEIKKSAKGIFDFSTTKKDDEETLNEEVKRIKKLL
jgi:hypothetical protein